MRWMPQQDCPLLKNAPSTRFSTACATIRIVPHIRRIASAQLEAGADEALRQRALDRVAARHRTGERDEGDARIFHDRSVSACDRCRTWNTPSGRPASREAFGEALGAQRRLRGVLQHHRIARHDRRHDAVHRDEIRVIPRGDGEHDAERLAAHEAREVRLRAGVDVRERLRRDVDHVARALERAAHFVRRVADRAAHLPRELERDGIAPRFERVAEAAADRCTLDLDDDAYPDPHWLTYLATMFASGPYAAVGGPNLPPPADPPVAQAVARAPGGPVHVLVSDSEAEHVPGCNMALRADAIRAIGGFDPRFRIAGDDVDMCWRLAERGWKIGFAPAAVVWHHRRDSVRAFWRQQRNYGRAEALLEQKWPGKYNELGHARWHGRVYGNAVARAVGRRVGRIYHGVWGSAPFQSVYRPADGLLASALAMPEWYLAAAALAGLSGLGALWPPLLLALPLLALTALAPLAHSVAAAAATRGPLRVRALTALLHVLQPLARFAGRVGSGLTPWRGRGLDGFGLLPRRIALWSDDWHPPEERLRAIAAALRSHGAVVETGGDFDPFDLEVRGGVLGGARLLLAIEDHGGGSQLVRVRVWPRASAAILALCGVLALLAALAALDGASAASIVLGAAATLVGLAAVGQPAAAAASALRAVRRHGRDVGDETPEQPARPLALARRTDDR